jgi:K+-transporting ATPase ATPase C chain
MNTLLVGLRAVVVLTLLTGGVYPFVVTGLAQMLFHKKANGSLLEVAGKPVGSSLIGQKFSSAAYFQGRPSAAGAEGYDATSSGGSNLSVTSQKLRDRATSDSERLRRENPEGKGPVPAELVLASGSGLDPHVSPASALWQVERVARARRLDAARVQLLVESSIEGRDLGLLGEPRVNVLTLNLALDQQFGLPNQ